MKALCIVENNKVAWRDIERPAVDPHGAILKPIAFAACTSDVHNAYESDLMEDDSTPVVLGHEGIGEVIETGEFVNDFKVGETVLIPPVLPYWRSVDIQDGNNAHAVYPFSAALTTTQRQGIFSEFFSVSDADQNLARIPEGVSVEDALMAADMVNTGFYGAELADIQFGDTVLVLGIGGVGLMCVAGSKLKGASRIVGVGSRSSCRKLAEEYGATDIINYKKQDVYKTAMEMTGGKGFDRVIVAGGPSSQLSLGILCLRFGGTLSNVNYFSEGDTIPIHMLGWGKGMSNKDIRSGLCPGGRRRMERMMDLIKYGRVKPSKMITHRFGKLEDTEQALLMMKDKTDDLIKPIVLLQ